MKNGTLELLVVDDDPDEKAILARYISKFRTTRFNVTWSGGLEDTLAQMSSRDFDTVLMDYRLVGCTAIDLLEMAPVRVRRSPIIVVTNFDDPSVDLEAYELGVESFINKRDLNERILERTIRYAMKNKDLENRLKDFSSILTHDLQSPLNNLSSLVSLLPESNDAGKASDLPDLCDMIHSEVKHLHALIGELSRYSRSHVADLKIEKVDLSVLMKSVKELLSDEIEKCDAKVVVEKLPDVKADPDIIIHVFMNLVQNALKYVRGKSPEVDISAIESNSRVTIAVSDNGIGFDGADAENIFKPLVRLHGRGEFQGTGLGLSICRQFVENHDGKIWAESVPGEGSTFYVELPAG